MRLLVSYVVLTVPISLLLIMVTLSVVVRIGSRLPNAPNVATPTKQRMELVTFPVSSVGLGFSEEANKRGSCPSNYTLSTVCPNCLNTMIRRNCKSICGICNFMWDCSEL